MELFNCISRPLKTYEYLISLLCPSGVFSSGNREIWLSSPSTLTTSDMKYKKKKKENILKIFSVSWMMASNLTDSIYGQDIILIYNI